MGVRKLEPGWVPNWDDCLISYWIDISFSVFFSFHIQYDEKEHSMHVHVLPEHSCPVGGQFDMEMSVHVPWYGLFYLILSFVRVFTGMCGSRKFPYPHHRRSLEILGGGGGVKGSNFQGEGGVLGKLLFQRVTNRVQNIESNVRSIGSKKKYLGTLFCNKSQ